ncbi:hypothetical protein D3C78_1097670 [compost metagenome]
MHTIANVSLLLKFSSPVWEYNATISELDIEGPDFGGIIYDTDNKIILTNIPRFGSFDTDQCRTINNWMASKYEPVIPLKAHGAISIHLFYHYSDDKTKPHDLHIPEVSEIYVGSPLFANHLEKSTVPCYEINWTVKKVEDHDPILYTSEIKITNVSNALFHKPFVFWRNDRPSHHSKRIAGNIEEKFKTLGHTSSGVPETITTAHIQDEDSKGSSFVADYTVEYSGNDAHCPNFIGIPARLTSSPS